MKVRLAIIIPYYKLTYFESTLQSLALQTDKRFKVYIGNDASLDDCYSLLTSFEGQFDFVYHRFENNLGGISLTQQWERCLELSSEEEWFMILGDDDVLSNSCIADFYDNLPNILETNSKVVRFATIINDMEHNILSPLYTHPTLEKTADFFYRRFTNQTRSSLSEHIFKKSSFFKYGFHNYNLAWHADDRAWLDFSEFKYIYSINSSYVIFRLSQENISRSGYKIQEKQQVSYLFFKFIINNYFYKFKRHQQIFLLLYFEQLVYKNKKTSFYFWLSHFFLFLISFNIAQSIKFTRRFLIHLKSNV
jgi:hypothetical protein